MTEAAIADHGLIGDLQTAALVSTDGSVDWFCCPRFDSPSVFGALLDDERGGRFRIRPAEGADTSKQMYFPDTAALITRFITENGVGEVIDFMPPAGRPGLVAMTERPAAWPPLHGAQRAAAGGDDVPSVGLVASSSFGSVAGGAAASRLGCAG